VAVAVVCLACDSAQLTAPTNSTISVNALSRVLPVGGSTEVSATVIESGGTPVQNGTVVRFTTTLGRVDPVEAQTRNGTAVTTFFAGDDSGVAEVRATSGGAGATTPPTTTPPTTTTTTGNASVLITVGAAAVDTVTVRANPAVVSANGGTVNVIATVMGVGGRLLSNIPVSFAATRGTLSSTSAMTDGNGEARVSLTTNADTDVTATAGSKTSTAARVTAQPGPSVTLTCAVGTATNCASVSVGQAITFTASRGATTSNIVSSTLDLGDGTTRDLGSLSSPATVSHSYSSAGTFTVRLTATDVNGETTTAVQSVRVLVAATGTLTATKNGMDVTATVNTTPPGTSFAWTFEGTTPNRTTTSQTETFTYTTAGTKTISVLVTLNDGRTLQLSTTITVP
jgi:hypothetical protein